MSRSQHRHPRREELPTNGGTDPFQYKEQPRCRLRRTIQTCFMFPPPYSLVVSISLFSLAPYSSNFLSLPTRALLFLRQGTDQRTTPINQHQCTPTIQHHIFTSTRIEHNITLIPLRPLCPLKLCLNLLPPPLSQRLT